MSKPPGWLSDSTIAPLKIDLIVRPVVHEDDTARGFFLVLFQEVPEGLAAEDPNAPRRSPPATPRGSSRRKSFA